MGSNKPLVDKQLIINLLYGDEEYLKEFTDASVESFTEFNSHFSEALSERDEEQLRRAGHKIKPVAQMMNLHKILEMYDTSKDYIENLAEDEKINQLIDEMDSYCNTLLEELKKLSKA